MGAASLMKEPIGEFFAKSGYCVKGLLIDSACPNNGSGTQQPTNEAEPTQVAGPVGTVLKWVYEGGKWVLKKVNPKPKIKLKKVPKPNVSDPKLKNITDDLYKGANTKSPIGLGSTADAIRYERATGRPVGGKYHTEKGKQHARALEKWLEKNPNASSSDRNAAKILFDDLNDALGGIGSG